MKWPSILALGEIRRDKIYFAVVVTAALIDHHYSAKEKKQRQRSLTNDIDEFDLDMHNTCNQYFPELGHGGLRMPAECARQADKNGNK